MSIILNLPAESEQALGRLAEEKGQAPAEYLKDLVEQAVRGASTPSTRSSDGAQEETELDRAIARMKRRTPEEARAARQRLEEAIEPGRPLPPGTTLFDAVAGKWPGDESDEEVARALRELS
jgi:hypothetical protein